jgi:hypothetical protein
VEPRWHAEDVRNVLRRVKCFGGTALLMKWARDALKIKQICEIV